MDGHGWTVDGTRYVVTQDETFTDWGDSEGEPILCTADSVPWQEEFLRLAAEADELRLTVASRDATLAMTVARLGGEVEGAPTARVNFLQRVDALREIEARQDRLRPVLRQCEATVQAQLHLNQRLRRPDGEAGALLGNLLAALRAELGKEG